MRKMRICFPNERTFQDGFEEYILDCKARNLREGTITHYREIVKQLYKRIPPDTPISSFSPQTMTRFYIALRDDPNLNEVSMGTYARDLKTLMRFFMKCNYIPHFDIPLPKADQAHIQTYTDDELKKLLKKPDVRNCIFSTYRSWVIINFLLSTGVRQNSLVNIKIRDVDFDNSVVYVNTTKNRKPLIIPLNEDIIKILREYLQYRGGGADTAPLLKRAFMFLEDGEWASANEYCEKVLDIDPENAQAFLGKLMADTKVCTKETLGNCKEAFSSNPNYLKVLRFGDTALKEELQSYITIIEERNEAERLARTYQVACIFMAKNQQEMYTKAAELFESIADYKDSASKSAECTEKAESIRKDTIYDEAKALMLQESSHSYKAATEKLETISDWRDASELIVQCKRCAEVKKVKEKKRTIIALLSFVVIGIVLVVALSVIGTNMQNDMRKTLSGKTFYGYNKDYTDGDVKKYTISFVDEEYCDISCFGYSFDGTPFTEDFTHVPYEIAGGLNGLTFDWDSSDCYYNSSVPFKIDSSGESIKMYTSTSSFRGIHLEEE